MDKEFAKVIDNIDDIIKELINFGDYVNIQTYFKIMLVSITGIKITLKLFKIH